jgi:hypothetical protein
MGIDTKTDCQMNIGRNLTSTLAWLRAIGLVVHFLSRKDVRNSPC